MRGRYRQPETDRWGRAFREADVRVVLSSHAKRKMRERIGAGDGVRYKLAFRAWTEGIEPPADLGVWKRLPSVSLDPRHAGHRYAYRMRGPFVYVFDRDARTGREQRPAIVLVTVLGPFGKKT